MAHQFLLIVFIFTNHIAKLCSVQFNYQGSFSMAPTTNPNSFKPISISKRIFQIFKGLSITSRDNYVQAIIVSCQFIKVNNRLPRLSYIKK